MLHREIIDHAFAPSNDPFESFAGGPVAVGVNYYDRNDGSDNEDIYKIDVTTNEMTPHMRGRFEEEYPEFADTHRAREALPPQAAD